MMNGARAPGFIVEDVRALVRAFRKPVAAETEQLLQAASIPGSAPGTQRL